MNKTVILVSALVVVAGIYLYTSNKSTAETPTAVGAKGTKQKGNFKNIPIGGQKSGISANVDTSGWAGAAGDFISGIFHPTNQNDTTSQTTASE